jgi:hypothetical protein
VTTQGDGVNTKVSGELLNRPPPPHWERQLGNDRLPQSMRVDQRSGSARRSYWLELDGLEAVKFR